MQTPKRTKILKVFYWITTLWLSLGMVSTAIVQLMKVQKEVDNFTRLGYPLYLMTLLGIWKIAGVIAVLLPRYPILKEWAYAGFFFAMSGAIFSHIAMVHPFTETFPSLLLLVLSLLSWYLRPAAYRTTNNKIFPLNS